LPLAAAKVERLGDGRCVGQGFDLVVPLPPGPYDRGDQTRAALQTAFEAGYREKFGRAPPEVPLEFINARVSVRVPVPGGNIAGLAGGGTAEDALKGTRQAWFAESGGFVEARVYHRDRLGPGARFAGPALVEDTGSTLVLGPAATAEVTLSGSILVDIK
jgi:N-methylhydantoinase A